jgi:hypothetical protein
VRPSDWAASAGAGTKCVHKDEMASGEVGCVYRCRGPEPDENDARPETATPTEPPPGPAPARRAARALSKAMKRRKSAAQTRN